MPVGDLGFGLFSQCVLEEANDDEQDDAPFVPDVATMKINLEDSNKVVAFSLLGHIKICDRDCHRTQVKDVSICLEKTAEESLMFTNLMKLKTASTEQIQTELSSNSLQHLQLAIDATASGILHQICRMKRKSIHKAFRSFETDGLSEVIPTATRTGYSSIPRGESGYIIKCTPHVVRPTSLEGLCCSNLPILTSEQQETEAPVEFLKSFSHEITSVCSPVICSDYIPVVFYDDDGDPICQTTRGLEHCEGGVVLDPQAGINIRFTPLSTDELQDPSLTTWLRSHFISLVNEITTSSNFQNGFFNILSTNRIRCKGLEACSDAEPLESSTMLELERITNSPFTFFMQRNIWGMIATYLCYVWVGASLFQAVLGLLLKLQQTLCMKERKSCTACEALICLCSNLDQYLNPLSLTRAQIDKRMLQTHIHLQELTGRSARKDIELNNLLATVALLESRLSHLEGFESVPAPLYHDLAPPPLTLRPASPVAVSFDTHRTARDEAGTDVLELVSLLSK